MRVLVVGTGGHARVVADAVLALGQSGQDYELAGVAEGLDDPSPTSLPGADNPAHIGRALSIPHDAVVVGVSDNRARARIFEVMKGRGEASAAIVHPRAVVTAPAAVGEGAVILAGAVVSAGASIGPNAVINAAATVDHDCVVGQHAHLSSKAHIGEAVRIGEGASLGIGCAVLPRLRIGSWAVVVAGAVTTGDVPDGYTVSGAPARTLGGEDVQSGPDMAGLAARRSAVQFASAGRDVVVYGLSKIVNPECIAVGDHVRIDDFSLIISGARSVFGSYVHIGAHSVITGGGEFLMGDFSGLSVGVRIFTGNEDFSGESFTSSAVPFPYRNPIRSYVHIGKFVAIGANAVVLPGVTIGDGCVIGANSLVTRDCEPWTVYFGNPARALKKRESSWLKEREEEVRALHRLEPVAER